MRTLENILRGKMLEAERSGDMESAISYLRELSDEISRNREKIKDHPMIEFAQALVDSATSRKGIDEQSIMRAVEDYRSAVSIASSERL